MPRASPSIRRWLTFSFLGADTTMPDYRSGVSWLLNQVAGTLPELFSAQRIVEAKRKERQGRTISDDDQRLRVPAPKLEAQVQEERDRIARIEDKARGTVVGITIAVSVAGAGIGMFATDGIFDSAGPLRIGAAIVLVFGLLFFLASGWLALLAYAASPLHTPDIGDRPETRATENPVSSEPSDDDPVWRRTLLDCLELNRFLATAKTNRFSASITLLRNGLVSIFLFALLAVSGAVFC